MQSLNVSQLAGSTAVPERKGAIFSWQSFLFCFFYQFPKKATMEPCSIMYSNIVSVETVERGNLSKAVNTQAVMHDISHVYSSWISLGRAPSGRQEARKSFVYLLFFFCLFFLNLHQSFVFETKLFRPGFSIVCLRFRTLPCATLTLRGAGWLRFQV